MLVAEAVVMKKETKIIKFDPKLKLFALRTTI